MLRWTGSADGLVELLLSLRGAVDGVRLLPVRAGGRPAGARPRVLPALRVARASPTPRPGATLRDTLGLPRPTSRFATPPGDLVTDLPRPHAHVHLGVFFQGVNHSTIWSDPASGSQTDFESFRQIVQTAERGLFDAFFLGEGLRLREQNGVLHDLDVVGRPDAITQLAALAAVTTHIGLAATQNVTYNDPADLARRLASLDLLSGGRAAWNIVTTDNAWTGENFRRGGWLDHDLRYVRAGEFVRAAQAIWDGTPGEPVTFAGQTLEIEVTPTVPRSPQGHPVLFQAGDSPAGRDFAARHAEVIFSAHGTDYDDALAFATDVRARTVAAGRPEDDLKILPGTQFILAATDAEAWEKARWVKEQQVTPATALSLLGQVWGEDLSGYDPDGPLPAHDPVDRGASARPAAHRAAASDPRADRPGVARPRGGREPHDPPARHRPGAPARVRRLARRPSPTSSSAGSAPARATGSTSRRGSCPAGLDDVVDTLVPELQERGAYRTEYTGTHAARAPGPARPAPPPHRNPGPDHRLTRQRPHSEDWTSHECGRRARCTGRPRRSAQELAVSARTSWCVQRRLRTRTRSSRWTSSRS